MSRHPKNTASATQARRGMAKKSPAVSPLLATVLQAARRCCDAMDDGPEARAQMERDVRETPPALLPDLLRALTAVPMRRADLLSLPSTYRPKE